MARDRRRVVLDVLENVVAEEDVVRASGRRGAGQILPGVRDALHPQIAGVVDGRDRLDDPAEHRLRSAACRTRVCGSRRRSRSGIIRESPRWRLRESHIGQAAFQAVHWGLFTWRKDGPLVAAARAADAQREELAQARQAPVGAFGDAERPRADDVAPERPARSHRRDFAQALDSPRLEPTRIPGHEPLYSGLGAQRGASVNSGLGRCHTSGVRSRRVAAKGGTRAGRSLSETRPAAAAGASSCGGLRPLVTPGVRVLPSRRAKKKRVVRRGLVPAALSRDAACGRGRRLFMRGGSAPSDTPGFSSSPFAHSGCARQKCWCERGDSNPHRCYPTGF